jgi:UDP-GlcNAc:undecaprenyl-phosphate GlcNAc-1-phosphate transferase
MTTILFTFIVGFMFSLALTPVARWVGTRFGAMDVPSARKVHTRPIPRSGGIAISLSFLLAIVVCTLLGTKISEMLVWNDQRIFAFLGGLLIFAVGLFDDFRGLTARTKLLFQILAATLAYYGGVRIEGFFIGNTGIHFGVMSWAVTVFWFLLLINAMNLIDGLDGLAAGVSFFAGVVMMAITVIQGSYLAALEFAALAGALLGFLRYNFNPASVFLGDGGSYFIGYTIAALAILGSLKSQVGATLLIPLLALGVPIFDTILSPLRRFILGRRMFQPDKGHIHHRLLMMGLSSSRAVLIIYGATTLLCMAGILIANIRNEMVGLLLIVLGAVSVVVVRKLGYLEYFATDKIFGWLRDVSDEVGITRDRRTFLSLQIELGSARNMDDLWENICRALEIMHFDRGELHLLNHRGIERKPETKIFYDTSRSANYEGRERRQARTEGAEKRNQDEFGLSEVVRVWAKGHHRRQDDVLNNSMLRIGIPLNAGHKTMYRLVLSKNLTIEPIHPHTLRRLELLRRSVTGVMNRLHQAPMMKPNPSLVSAARDLQGEN